MLNITKCGEPKELKDYRKRPDAAWDGPGFAPVKRKIRDTLRIEQKGLCAYCMGKLGAYTRIEHHIARNACATEDEKLKYGNMLLCCSGYPEDKDQDEQRPPQCKGETPEDYKKRVRAKRNQTCDLHKQGKPIKNMPNPADPAVDIEQSVSYRNSDGSIVVPSDWEEDVDVTLNLNASPLKVNRKTAMDTYQALFVKSGRSKADEIDRMRKLEKAPPYLGCLLYLLVSCSHGR